MSLKESFGRSNLKKTVSRVGVSVTGIAIATTMACANNKEANTPTLPSDRPISIMQAVSITEIVPTVTFQSQPTLIPTKTQVVSSEIAPKSTVEAKAEEVSFIFGEGVTLEQQKEIKDGIMIAREWFFAKTDIKINGVSVFAFTDASQLADQYFERTIYPQPREDVRRHLAGATAFVGERKDMFINLSSPGWTSFSPIINGPVAEGRLHTLAHEWVHIFQREVGGYNGSFPHWLNEGGAHYAAARELSDNNIYSSQAIKDGHIKEASKMTESLQSMESLGGFYNAGSPYADEYSLAELAVEFLVKDLPGEGIPAIASFWQEIGKGNPWQTAFETAFGQTPAEFYPKFEQWRENGFR